MTELVAGTNATYTGLPDDNRQDGHIVPGSSVFVIEHSPWTGDGDFWKVFDFDSGHKFVVAEADLKPIEEATFQLEMPGGDTVVFRITGHSDKDILLAALAAVGVQDTLAILSENL